MRNRKVIALCCAASLALSLTACGSTNQSTAGTGADTDTKTAEAVQVTATDISLEGATTLTFSQNGVAAQDGDYTGYAVDGTAVEIDGAGTYILTGSCEDGSVTVKKGVTGVTLVLSGLELTSAGTAPITCNKSSQVVIYAAAGTDNVLTDSAENNDDSYPDNTEAENAVIKCKDGSQVVLCGSGSLTVNANGKNGIKSGASTAEEGEASLTIRELTLTINAPVNDAVNAEQLLTVESGTLTIDAGDDALHSDLALNIGAEGAAGPTITINSCYEGIEGAALNIYSGDIRITASDDCLNAANGDLSGYSFSMNISGGTIAAYTSGGDGFDSNGSLTISGGSVTVWSASSADNQPLDADGAITITGGTVLAAGGSSGMGMKLTAEQPCVSFSGRLSKGAAFTVEGGSGTLYSGTALCDAGFVFFSSPELAAEESCTLTSGGSTAATAAAQSGSVQTGMGGMDGQPGQMPGGFGDGQRPELPGNTDGSQRPTPPQGGFQPGGGQ